jgi:hypothetical protein
MLLNSMVNTDSLIHSNCLCKCSYKMFYLIDIYHCLNMVLLSILFEEIKCYTIFIYNLILYIFKYHSALIYISWYISLPVLLLQWVNTLLWAIFCTALVPGRYNLIAGAKLNIRLWA